MYCRDIHFEKNSNTQRVKRTHLQLITQCDLWNQRIFCPTMNKTKELVFLADRSLSFIEEFLLEMIVIREEGCMCYVSSPSLRNKVIQTIHPSVVICDDKESNQMADTIVSYIYDCKRSSQQQIWKQYSANVLSGSLLPCRKILFWPPTVSVPLGQSSNSFRFCVSVDTIRFTQLFTVETKYPMHAFSSSVSFCSRL